MDKKQIAVYEVKGLFREARSRIFDITYNLSIDNIGKINLTDIRELLNRIEERSKEFINNDIDDNELY